MNPKVAKKGRSFKGAGAYYLHDKDATTANRVAFTHTENLPTDNPETALKIMAYTAMHQKELKAASGQVNTGRTTKTHVYSYSLSWHPSEDPSQQEMLEAAQETLNVLKLQDHEAILVAHNDTPHPHIHVIVNRVHPETGILDTHSCDQLRLSQWAEQYQIDRGQEHFTPERTKNNARRREAKRKGKSGETEKSGFIKHQTKYTAANVRRFKQEQLKRAYDSGTQHLTPAPPLPKFDSPRNALYAEKEAHINRRRQDVREENRPQWAALYKRQYAEIALHQKNLNRALYRLTTYLKTREKGAPGLVLTSIRAFFGKTDFIKTDLTKHIINQHEVERKTLSTQIYEKNRVILQQENRTYRKQVDELKKLQPKPRTSQQAREEFEKRVAARTRRRKRKRGDKGKGYGRERDD